jgi:hypothetical protein
MFDFSILLRARRAVMLSKYFVTTAFLLVLATNGAAHAGFTVSLSAGGEDSVNLSYDFATNSLTSTVSGDASLLTANYSDNFGPTISFMGRVGGFYIPVLYITSNFPGEDGILGGNITDFSLTAQNQSGVTGQLVIDVLMEDWLLPGGSGSELTLSNNLNSAWFLGQGSVTFASFYDIGSDRQYTDPVVITPGNLGGEPTSTSFTRGATYDMGHTVTVDLTGRALVAFDANTHSLNTNSQASLPELSSLVCWGLGAGIAFVLLRRRKV